MANIKKDAANRKTESIIMKCTAEEKKIIEKSAARSGRKVSCYVLDRCLEERDRGKSRRKKEVRKLVEQQEQLNHLCRKMQNSDISPEMKKEIELVLEGGAELWGF